MTDLTVNIRGLTVPTPSAAAALRTLGSRWALVESNPGQARELAAQGWRIVYRDYWPGSDDNLHDHTTPAEWVAHMAALNLPADVLWYCGNEPTHDYEPLQDWLLEAMRLARGRGRRLVVGNFSTGLPGELDWRDLFGPLLDALADGWHILGLHEYLCVAYALSKPWHVGRFQFLLDACKQDGRTPPRIMITEHGFDLSGSWQSMGLSTATFAAEVGLAMREVYRPANVEAVFLFSLGAWQNKQGWEFDVTPALGELAKIGQGEEPMDETLYAATLRILSASGSRLRALPTTSGGIITVLPQGEHAAICGNRQTNDGYAWAHVTVAGQTGWVALEATDGSMTTLAEVTPVEPQPAPEPEPTPEPEPQPAPAASWAEFLRTMRELLTTWQQATAVMLEYIEEEIDKAA